MKSKKVMGGGGNQRIYIYESLGDKFVEVGSNELHLLEYILWVTNTFRVYLKMGTFILTQIYF